MRNSTSIEEIEIFYLLKEATQKKVELPKNKYELSNHLGNVLVTVSDLRKGTDNNADGKADYYQADVQSANDYYAFGSYMNGRQYNSTAYNFGFVGQEKDDEVIGNGNRISFSARVYDSRLGRFLSSDPDFKKYAWNSVYNYAQNMPIWAIDIYGRGTAFYYDCGYLGVGVDGSIINIPNAQYIVITYAEGNTAILKNSGTIVEVPEGAVLQYEVNGIVTKAYYNVASKTFGYRTDGIPNQNWVSEYTSHIASVDAERNKTINNQLRILTVSYLYAPVVAVYVFEVAAIAPIVADATPLVADKVLTGLSTTSSAIQSFSGSSWAGMGIRAGFNIGVQATFNNGEVNMVDAACATFLPGNAGGMVADAYLSNAVSANINITSGETSMKWADMRGGAFYYNFATSMLSNGPGLIIESEAAGQVGSDCVEEIIKSTMNESLEGGTQKIGTLFQQDNKQ